MYFQPSKLKLFDLFKLNCAIFEWQTQTLSSRRIFWKFKIFFCSFGKMDEESERAFQNYKRKGYYIPYDSEGDLLIDVFM